MSTQLSGLDALKDIRRMMDRSSRFISLSGWSGISAGIVALVGTWLAAKRIQAHNEIPGHCLDCLKTDLILIAGGVFIMALIFAFAFTYLRSKRDGVAIWGSSAKKLLWNTCLPMVVGAVFILRLSELNELRLIVPASLIFYGLALINGSRFTLGEVRYLGYAQVSVGLLNLWFLNFSLYWWALGFGILHIIYGIAMFWKYERKEGNPAI